MEILRKLTIKTCGGFTKGRIIAAIVENKLEEGQALALLRIVGHATSAKTGTTDNGQFTKLIGQFVGTDLLTGQLYQSGVCILPDFVGAQLGVAAIETQSVKFAFEITAKRSDSSVTGYEFGIKPLIETKPSDAMAELMALGGIKAPGALAAPTGNPEPAPAPAPAPEAVTAASPAPAPAAASAKSRK